MSLDAGVGTAHVNVLTAMRTGLALALKLNTAALERDPANSLPLPPLWRRVYGVYGSGSMWRLLLMVADEKGDFVRSYSKCIVELTADDDGDLVWVRYAPGAHAAVHRVAFAHCR